MKLLLRGLVKDAALPTNVTPQHVHTLLRQPEVAAYARELHNRKKIKEKATSWKLPATALGLGAAGYGMKRLGDAAFTPEDRDRITDLTGLAARVGKEIPPTPAEVKQDWWKPLAPDIEPSKDFKGSPSLFYDYIDRASRASQTKPYNIEAPEFIHKAKKLLGFKDIPWQEQNAYNAESDNHYPSFVRGPADAYAHQVVKNFTSPYAYEYPQRFIQYPNDMSARWHTLSDQDRQAIRSMYYPSNIENLQVKDPAADIIGSTADRVMGRTNITRPDVIGTPDNPTGGLPNAVKKPFNFADIYSKPQYETTGNPAHKFISGWKSEFDNYLTKGGFKPLAYTAQGSRMDPAIRNLNHGKQMELIKGFQTHLAMKDPVLAGQHEALLKSLSDPQSWASRNYSAIGRNAIKLFQDWPRNIGYGLMAGGGALGAGWLLNKYLHRKKQQQKPSALLNPVQQQPVN